MAIDYTAHLRADGERMARAIERDLPGLDSHVPSCPEWNVGKLTIHTGQHHRWVAEAVRGGGEVPGDPPRPGRRGAELVEWFQEGWADLANLLDGKDDDEPSWSWSGDNRVGFWRRRTALETLVHRWDAENATGDTSPLDPELSADGIDELLFVMIGDDPPAYRGPSVVVMVEPNDSPLRWTLRLEDGKEPARAKGTDAVSSVDAPIVLTGTSEEVLLFLWGRYDRDRANLTGDEDHMAALVRWMES